MKGPSFWGNTVPTAMNFYAIAIFAVLWVGFTIAMIANREWLDILWSFVGDLPVVARVIVWVLLLPIMVGLWIWESSWPALVRILGFAGVAGWTLLAVSSFVRFWSKGPV